MDIIKECRRCARPIQERFQSLQKQPDPARWIKLGYCSNACFKRDRNEQKISKELEDSVLDKRETVPEAKNALIAALLGLFLVSFIVTTPLVFIYSAKAKKKIASNPKDYKGLHTVKNAIVLVVLEVILILVIYSIVNGPLIDFT